MNKSKIKTEIFLKIQLCLFCIFFSFFCLYGCDRQKTKQPAKLNPADVTVLELTPVDLPITTSFIAEIKSSHQVEILPRISGFIEKVVYKEGNFVKKGDLLYIIDSKPFKAQLAANKAEVQQKEAEKWIAKANLDRIRPLAEKNAASKSDLDNAVGRLRTAEASLLIAMAKLEKSELDMSYTQITSPINGIAGKSLIQEGSYITSGSMQAKLTTITAMDPLWAEFSISQNQMLKNRKEVREGAVISPGKSLYEIEIEFPDGKIYPYTGRFNFFEPTFNDKTGTFTARIEIPNPEDELAPGMFVTARIKGAYRPNVVLVPQKAVQQTANGHIVYVVNNKNIAEIRHVVAGEWSGQDWIINQGLNKGEKIIVEGFQKIMPGTPVNPINMEKSDKSEKK